MSLKGLRAQRQYHGFHGPCRPSLPDSALPALLDLGQPVAVAEDCFSPLLETRVKPRSLLGVGHSYISGLTSKAGIHFLAASTVLVEGATKPAVRCGLRVPRSRHATNWSSGRVSSTSAGRTLTGGAEKVSGWISSGLRGYWVPRADSRAPVCRAAESNSSVPVELKLLSGLDSRIQVEADMSVAQLREHVRVVTGLVASQQAVVIAEDRARLPGISKLARKVHTSISSTRRDLRSALISWVNFIFLPEFFNRELYGRGMISWAKGTTWFQSLQEAQNRAAVAAAASQDNSTSTAKIQIEQLSGQVVLLEVELDASLGELKFAIEQRLGILREQQRLLILERPGPGRLTHLTNTMLLHTLTGMKLALGAAVWAGSSLLCKPDATFPICVRTTAGRAVSLTITGDTTVNQIRSMLEESSELPGAEEVQDVSFPSHLPPLRTEAPNSHIIRAVGV